MDLLGGGGGGGRRGLSICFDLILVVRWFILFDDDT